MTIVLFCVAYLAVGVVAARVAAPRILEWDDPSWRAANGQNAERNSEALYGGLVLLWLPVGAIAALIGLCYVAVTVIGRIVRRP